MELSIIIPAYNVENTIETCVESIQNQNYEDFEIIIVDDGSKDNTLNICYALEQKYTNIRILHQVNSGVSVARNNGINNAKGNWIMFVDGDDGLQVDSLSHIDFDINTDMIFLTYKKEWIVSLPQIINSQKMDANILKKIVLNYPKYYDIAKHTGVIDSLSNWTCWGKCFKRQIIQENHILFPEGITYGEDLLFCYQYYSVVQSVMCIDLPLYFYRIDANSVSHRFNPHRISNTNKIFSVLKSIDKSIINDSEYEYFVFDRLFACIEKYFSKINTELSIKEKEYRLKDLCLMDDYYRAIAHITNSKLAIGKKTKIKKLIILKLLRKQKYSIIIKMYNR